MWKPLFGALLLAAFAVPAPAIAAETLAMCVPGQKRASDANCIVDGDTLWLHGENIRLKDFDTPEPTTAICGGDAERALAAKASARLRELLNTHLWTIERFGKERNGRGQRTLATIRVAGEDVGDVLIREGLARRWPDGGEFWCSGGKL